MQFTSLLTVSSSKALFFLQEPNACVLLIYKTYQLQEQTRHRSLLFKSYNGNTTNTKRLINCVRIGMRDPIGRDFRENTLITS